MGVQEMSGLLRAAAGAERLTSVSEPPFWLSVEEAAAVAVALPAPAWARLARAVPEVAPPVVLVVPDRGHRRALAEVGAHRRRVAQLVTACLRPTIPGRPQETVGEVPAVPAAPVALSPRAAAVVAGSSVAEVVGAEQYIPGVRSRGWRRVQFLRPVQFERVRDRRQSVRRRAGDHYLYGGADDHHGHGPRHGRISGVGRHSDHTPHLGRHRPQPAPAARYRRHAGRRRRDHRGDDTDPPPSRAPSAGLITADSLDSPPPAVRLWRSRVKSQSCALKFDGVASRGESTVRSPSIA